MRIDEIHIDNYGPLAISLDLDAGLNVLHGPNESGKTLMVDALLWLLAEDDDDDRIGQRPHGYVVLDDGSHRRRLDAGESMLDRLEAVHDIDLSATTFRNSFTVRSADATLTAEDRYYDRATDIVAESLVADVRRLSSAVADRGRITESNRLLWNRKDDGYVRDDRDDARTLRDELHSTIDRSREQGVPRLEADLFSSRQHRQRLSDEIEALEVAERRETLADADALCQELGKTIDEREALPSEEAINDLERTVTDAIDAEVRASELRSQRQQASRQARTAVIATAVVSVVTMILAAGVMVSTMGINAPSLVGAGAFVSLITAVPAAMSVYHWRSYTAAVDELESLDRITHEAAAKATRHGIDDGDPSTILARIESTKARMRTLDRSIATMMGRLSSSLDLTGDSPTEFVAQATDRIETLQADLPEVDIEFDQSRLEEAREQHGELDGECEELARALSEFHTEVKDLLDRVTALSFGDYGIDSPDPTVRSIEGLERAVDCVDALIERIETDAHNAEVALDVLSIVEAEERSAVEELFFGTESEVTQYFSTITDGRYRSVSYDTGEETLVVETSRGDRLTPDQLSQSTFDQLYFSVRVAFGRALLGGVPGVFILDDAFLAADSHRFDRQAEILGDLSDNGWQLLYFTAKEDNRARLGDLVNSTCHELPELDPL